MAKTTTLSTARQCPRCNTPGELITKAPTEDVKLTGYVFQCNNKVCPWFDTRWVVTVDDDDKVQTRDPGHDPKRFPAVQPITDKQQDGLLDWIEDDEA